VSAADPRLGATIGGKYRIVRWLADGGVGSVYEAQHLLIKRRFAVKFLRSDLLGRRDVLSRFQREAEAAGALESENIGGAIDFGITEAGEPYLLMEYLEGSDLAALSAAVGRLPPERATDLVLQACAGMQRAHAAGVLHRDLKPRNLFVCRRSDGTDLVKVVDFGVAKLLDAEALQQLTITGNLVGTPAYMSPEQARGESNLDARADVYALGAILYELLSGRLPHPGASHNALIYHIATEPALSLPSGERPLPAALVEAVESALATRPEQRPASAEEFACALAPFARRQPWPITPGAPSPVLESRVRAASPLVAAAPSVPAPPFVTSPALRRTLRLAVVAAAVAGALAAVLFGGLWLQRPRPLSPAPSEQAPALFASPPARSPSSPESALSARDASEPRNPSAAQPESASSRAVSAAPAPAAQHPKAERKPPPPAPRPRETPPRETPPARRNGAQFDRDNPY
jgi:serine/threonine-protein kinase